MVAAVVIVAAPAVVAAVVVVVAMVVIVFRRDFCAFICYTEKSSGIGSPLIVRKKFFALLRVYT